MYIILAILIFGFLIFIHELGHFLTAKANDVQVNEFAICMGPPILQKTVGETTYSLRSIPIGGFCAMEGEDEESENPRAFTSKVWWRRLMVLAAGSVMNFLTGFLILVILYAGVSGFVVPVISGFDEGCPLESAEGLQVGDEILRVDGRRILVYSELSEMLSKNTTGKFDLVLRRDGKRVTLEDFPMEKRLYTTDGESTLRYGILFTLEPASVTGVVRTAWHEAMYFGRVIWVSLGDLLRGHVKMEDMSGPVGIVGIMSETGQSSETVADGVANVCYLGSFIAVNLAIMNLLPLPALDGGRIFLLLINTLFTSVTKQKIPTKYEGYIHAGGMILLLAFMVFVTLKDIWGLVR